MDEQIPQLINIQMTLTRQETLFMDACLCFAGDAMKDQNIIHQLGETHQSATEAFKKIVSLWSVIIHKNKLCDDPSCLWEKQNQ